MFKLIASLAFLVMVSAAPGLIAQTHSIVQPAAYIDTGASSAITHQSNVNLVRKIPLSPVLPVVHAAPLSIPVVAVKTVLPAVIKTVHSTPLVHSAPIVSTYAATGPVIHSADHSVPLVKTVVATAPLAYTTFHK